MSTACQPTEMAAPRYAVKEPRNLSPRIRWLREFYFQGVQRAWNNEYTAWTTGTAWDFQYPELSFHIVPETYAFLQTFRSSFAQAARPVTLHGEFWRWSLPERRAWFVREVLGAPEWRWISINQANCGLTVLHQKPGRPWTLLTHNDTGHLPVELRTGLPDPLLF